MVTVQSTFTLVYVSCQKKNAWVWRILLPREWIRPMKGSYYQLTNGTRVCFHGPHISLKFEVQSFRKVQKIISKTQRKLTKKHPPKQHLQPAKVDHECRCGERNHHGESIITFYIGNCDCTGKKWAIPGKVYRFLAKARGVGSSISWGPAKTLRTHSGNPDQLATHIYTYIDWWSPKP